MSLPQGIAFRQNGGFVTDGASDFCCDYVSAYPTTSTQGNTVGWEAGASSARDRSATIPRLAGKVGIDAPTIGTFRIDLPATGNYNVYLAAGEAAYSAETKTELFDTTSSLGVLESGSTGAANSFKDAANNTRTASNWVSATAGGGTAFAATFSTTICRFKAGDGALNCSISYFYIEAAGGGGTTVALTGVSGTGAVGTLAPAVSAALTGNAGAGTVGTPVASVSAPLTGNAGTGVVGTLTPVSGVMVALTGVSGTGAVGSLAPAVSLALTGVQGTGVAGTLTVDTGAIDLGVKKTRRRAKQKRIEAEQRIEREYLESLKPPAPVAKKRAPIVKAETVVDVVKPAPSVAKAPAVAQAPAVEAPVERDLAAEVDFKMQYWSRFLVLVIDNFHSH